MAMGNYESNRRGVILQLRDVQKRANQGVHTHEDYRTIIKTLIKLTNMVFDPLIEEERRLAAEIQLEREMDSEWEG